MQHWFTSTKCEHNSDLCIWKIDKRPNDDVSEDERLRGWETSPAQLAGR